MGTRAKGDGRALAATAAVVAASVVLTVGVSWLLYEHTVNLLTKNLQGNLLGLARTAAAGMEPHDLELLRTESDWKKPVWGTVVHRLERVRLTNDKVLFAYIVRKDKADPEKIEFVADSHSINPYAKIDLNHDGVINDADLLQWPGQPYPDPPPEIFEAYNHPVTTRSPVYDQWGVEMVGYAPIKDAGGATVAIMAIDMRADDFLTITRQTLYPFLVFIAFLVSVLCVLTVILARLRVRQVQQMAQIDQQKDTMIGIVSHQLNNPIASLRSNFSDLLDGEFGALSTPQVEQLRQDLHTTDVLKDLVSLLLEASRIEFGKLSTHKEKYSLASFFHDLLPNVEQAAKQKGLRLVHSLPPALPDGVFDRRLTHMAVENLLNNAVKYTPAGGTVELRVELEEGLLRCRVSDTGIGIPLADQGHLFGKMVRASNAQGIPGTGLGLYVVKGAIEGQGGRIRFSSTEGKGTTFWVELPV